MQLQNHPKWLSHSVLFLAIGVAGFLAYSSQEVYIEPTRYFSQRSLQAFSELNQEYQMVVLDLSTGEKSPLLAELFQADVLISGQKADLEARGLVVSLDKEKTEGEFLLLQPVNPLSDLSLQALAGLYQEAIAEFGHVEVDQNLELSGWPTYFFPYIQEKVELSTAEEASEPTDESVKVAVIDSGVDPSHEIFEGKDLRTGWNTITGDTTMYDDVGHGTHIAGIIAKNAPEATLIPYKIVDSNGGKLSNVLEALDKALEDKVDIVNMSFGLLSPSYALEELVNEAYEEGIVLMAAAGNMGNSEGFYPATYDHTISVASVYATGEKMPKSNYGDWVDTASYGWRIWSSLPEDEYGYKSGTSQATAFVTAKLANFMLESLESEEDVEFKEALYFLASSAKSILKGELAGVYLVE